MTVARFMTREPASIEDEATPEAALQLMDELHIRHLPVLEEGRLAGIVSDRDLLTWTGWRFLGGRRDERATRPLGELMHRHPISVGSEEPALAALVELVAHGIGCVPVVDQGKLVGIVTEADVLGRFLVDGAFPTGQIDLHAPVASVATPAAQCVSPDATLAQVDDLVHARGYRHLPVVRDGVLIGMLSDRDLRQAHGAHVDPGAAVETLMTRRVLSIEPEAPISEAVERMLEHKISALPVTDRRGLGIVTADDILSYGLRVLEGRG